MKSFRSGVVALLLSAFITTAQTPNNPQKIDLNNASVTELKTLPGVGAAVARKIVAGRPYNSVSDLMRAGVNASTIRNLTPLVTIGPAHAQTSPESARELVWVNKGSKVFHKQGDPWYGKTANGAYMKEADAIKAGYHPAKQRKSRQ